MPKVSSLSGGRLDWAVASALGATFSKNTIGAVHSYIDGEFIGGFVTKTEVGVAMPYNMFSPSKFWEQGGPIIEKERISLSPSGYQNRWYADRVFSSLEDRDDWYGHGDSPLIAAMRAFVMGILGENVVVPDEISQ